MNEREESVRFEELQSIISETLETKGAVTFTANGSSMLPAIRGGLDRVTIETLLETPKIGDVIFYRRKNGAYILHRVISVKDGTFTFCGDNQFIREKGIAREQLIGIVTAVERNGKELDLNSFSAKAYRFFLPCRRFLLRIRHYAGVVIRRLTRKEA